MWSLRAFNKYFIMSSVYTDNFTSCGWDSQYCVEKVVSGHPYVISFYCEWVLDQMLFLQLLRWSCGFCLFSCWRGVSHWLICICWTIVMTLRWVHLGRGVWSFLSVVNFHLLIFCWEFLHLYSSRILACNFFFFFLSRVCLWFWYQGNGGFIECLWEYSFLFILLKEFQKNC